MKAMILTTMHTETADFTNKLALLHASRLQPTRPPSPTPPTPSGGPGSLLQPTKSQMQSNVETTVCTWRHQTRQFCTSEEPSAKSRRKHMLTGIPSSNQVTGLQSEGEAVAPRPGIKPSLSAEVETTTTFHDIENGTFHYQEDELSENIPIFSYVDETPPDAATICFL